MNLQNLPAAFAALLWLPTCALAVDGVSLELGRGTERIEMFRVGVQWEAPTKWFSGTSWHVARYWDLSFGAWEAPKGTIHDFALTPVFRLENLSGSRYLEAAIGFHVISDVDFGRGYDVSTRFQFGDHIGAGMRFGERLENDIALRLQHLSNGGLREPNPGINFLQLRFQRHFN